jgi:hypothetical protein
MSATPFGRTVGPGWWCSCGERCEETEDGFNFCPRCDNRADTEGEG